MISKRNRLLSATIIVNVMLAGFVIAPVYLLAQTANDLPVETTPPDIRSLIEQKSAELQKIQEQKDAVQKDINVLTQSQNSLKREIHLYDNSISQLNLSIKANTINLDKIGYEMITLQEDIKVLENATAHARDTIGLLFVELQQRDRDGILNVLLRSRNLSENFDALHSLTRLNSRLIETATAFRILQEELIDKLDNSKIKKQHVEIEKTTLSSQQRIVEEQKSGKQQLLNSTKNQEKVYQEQLSEIEKQQAEISSEIEKIEAILRQNIDPNLLPISRSEVLLWPVPGGSKTQDYGSTPFALRNYKGKFHNGVDIGGVAIGTPIFAAEKGRVINVGDQDKYCPRGSYGKFVVVKHENGLTTLYAHLSKTNVTIGSLVERGDVIGYLGRTGWATGPHLHFVVFASATLTPARPGFAEGSQPSRQCGPMPVGGHLDPYQYL